MRRKKYFKNVLDIMGIKTKKKPSDVFRDWFAKFDFPMYSERDTTIAQQTQSEYVSSYRDWLQAQPSRATLNNNGYYTATFDYSDPYSHQPTVRQYYVSGNNVYNVANDGEVYESHNF